MKALPLARQSSLVIKEVDDETLVYDKESEEAHCLNNTAARVWQSCDGKTSVSEIAERLSVEGEVNVDDEIVWLALDQLEKFKLLDETAVRPAHLAGMNRRQLVARIGIAALAMPAIVSIVAPRPSAAASPLPLGACCNNPNQCGSNCCESDINNPCTQGPPNKVCKPLDFVAGNPVCKPAV